MTKLRTNLVLLVASALQGLSLESVRREEGQTLAEYALILSVIAIGVIAAVFFLRDSISGLFTNVGSKI